MEKKLFISICIILIISTIGIVYLHGKIRGIKDDKENNNIKQNEIEKNNVTRTNIEGIWENKEIFENYYKKSTEKLKTLTLDEKISQIFLVRYPNEKTIEELQKYKFGGYIFFEKDFRGKTKKEIQNRMESLQEVSDIPILVAVDEEGGTVVRVSGNRNLWKYTFKSPMELYKLGGFDKIAEDTIEKSRCLSNLGINLNLAPVVDVCTNKSDYMYKRTLGEGTKLTSTYAKTVINASKNTKVSYTLKHFPGYGNNVDTHKGTSIDQRTCKEIMENDLLPFKAGIEAGAEAVLVSHNIVTSIDNENPASLSKKVHNLLREEMNFTGIIITDDLDMGAVSNDKEAVIKAVQSGNDLIITTDYKNSIESVRKAIQNGKISEETIDKAVHRILAWKYYKGLM